MSRESRGGGDRVEGHVVATDLDTRWLDELDAARFWDLAPAVIAGWGQAAT